MWWYYFAGLLSGVCAVSVGSGIVLYVLCCLSSMEIKDGEAGLQETETFTATRQGQVWRVCKKRASCH